MRTYRIGKLDIDRERLAEDLARMREFKFSEAYSNYLCGGPWKSCMLWSIGGETGDGLVTNYDYSKGPAKTAFGQRLEYLSELVERWFNLDRLNFARVAIISNSVIIPHKDLLELSDLPRRERNTHRLHVPLVTNEGCYFSEGNVVYRMREGEVWFFDAGMMHSAASFTERERVHLILDFCEVEGVGEIVKFKPDAVERIPEDSIQAREALSAEEREGLMRLAGVITEENYKDVFSIVIKKHYRKDGGDDFVWETMKRIASRSEDEVVEAKVREMHEYFMVKRSA
jgi:hypothetical protein